MVIADAREAIRGGRRGGEARRSVERGDLRRNIGHGDARKSIESRISRQGPAKNIDDQTCEGLDVVAQNPGWFSHGKYFQSFFHKV